jgi:hypothetical protein
MGTPIKFIESHGMIGAVTTKLLHTTCTFHDTEAMRSPLAENDWWRIAQSNSHYGGLHWYFSETDIFNVLLVMPALQNITPLLI